MEPNEKNKIRIFTDPSEKQPSDTQKKLHFIRWQKICLKKKHRLFRESFRNV